MGQLPTDYNFWTHGHSIINNYSWLPPPQRPPQRKRRLVFNRPLQTQLRARLTPLPQRRRLQIKQCRQHPQQQTHLPDKWECKEDLIWGLRQE